MSTSTSALEADISDPNATVATKAARPSKKLMIAAGIGAVVVAAGVSLYLRQLGLESTDDAQVDADLLAVPARASGAVTKVNFRENQQVKAGDLLVELDADQARARLTQAEAGLLAAKASAEAADADARVAETNAHSNRSLAEASLQGAASGATASKQQISEGEAMVASATANLDRATNELDRAKKLMPSGALTQAQFDQAQTAYDASTAGLDQARAHLAWLKATTSQALSRVQEANAKLAQSSDVDALITQARARARMAEAQVSTAQAARDLVALDLSYTKILAPEDGVVSKKTVSIGQMVAPGQPIVQLIPANLPWITANFKETQLAHMRVGQPAHLSVDAYPGVTIHGEVESFSAATGARFSLLPPDNATGNFTKVVQRVPVRVHLLDIPSGVTLRPGMSVELTVDTRR